MDIVAVVLGGTAAMGAFATAGAVVAGAKGRHAAGAIWGMLLGPVGLLVACLLDPDVAHPGSDVALGPGLGTKQKTAPTTGRGTLGDGMR